MLRNRILIRLFEALERSVYRSATAITVMSDGNGDYVVAKGADRSSVHTVPNWVDTDAIRPGQRLNDFRRQHGIGGQFLVVFAGAMGWSQGMEVVIDAARQLADQQDLLFLLVGHGVERPAWQAARRGSERPLPAHAAEGTVSRGACRGRRLPGYSAAGGCYAHGPLENRHDHGRGASRPGRLAAGRCRQS